MNVCKKELHVRSASKARAHKWKTHDRMTARAELSSIHNGSGSWDRSDHLFTVIGECEVVHK